MEKRLSFLPKIRYMLAKASNGLGPGPWGSCENPTLEGKGLWLSVPRPPVCGALEMSCVSCSGLPDWFPDDFVLLYDSFIADAPIFPFRKTVYKIWHFLTNLLGITHSLLKTFWSQTFLSSLSSDVLVLPLRDLSLKNNLLVQESHHGVFIPGPLCKHILR